MQFTRLTSFTFMRTEAFELYQGLGFRNNYNTYSFSSEWFKWLAAQGSYAHGSGVNYCPVAGYQPFPGDRQNGSLDLTLRPTPRLMLEEKYLYSHLRTRPGWQFTPTPTRASSRFAPSSTTTACGPTRP